MTMTGFERWSVWLTTAGTLVTGVVYWWMKDLMPPPDPFAVVNHPLQPWMLNAHILIAPLQVFAVGLITSRHIWRHYRMGVKKGRRSGILAAGTFIVLALTGYGLQVVSADLVLRVLAWSHLILGVVYSIGVAAHWPATRGNGRPAITTESAGAPNRAPVLGGSSAPSHDRRRRSAKPGRERAQR